MSLPRRFLNWFARPRNERKFSHGPVVERPRWWSRVAIHQTTTLRTPLEEELPLYQQLGIPGIGLSHLKLGDLSVAEIVDELRASSVSVSSVGVVGGFTRFNGHSYEDAIQEGQRLIQLAQEVGAPVVTVITGPIAGHLRKHARDLLIDGLGELLPTAHQCGVRLALQPMAPVCKEWSFLHTLDAAMSVITEIRSSHLGLAFGTYHLGREHHVLRRIESVAPWIASVQLSDWVPTTSDNDRRLPGEGQLPLAEIVTAIESTGYRGWYELEVWSRDLWKQDAESLMNRCLQSLGCLVAAPTPVDAR
jgi:sugar phosphate isomerase/epimerase